MKAASGPARNTATRPRSTWRRRSSVLPLLLAHASDRCHAQERTGDGRAERARRPARQRAAVRLRLSVRQQGRTAPAGRERLTERGRRTLKAKAKAEARQASAARGADRVLHAAQRHPSALLLQRRLHHPPGARSRAALSQGAPRAGSGLAYLQQASERPVRLSPDCRSAARPASPPSRAAAYHSTPHHSTAHHSSGRARPSRRAARLPGTQPPRWCA
jgi:hypothetical protein